MKLRRTFTLLLCTALLIAAVGLSGCFRSLPNEATGSAPAESQSYSMPTAPEMPTVSLPTAPTVTTEIPTVTLPPVSEIPTVPTTVPPVTVPPTLPPVSEVPTTAAPLPTPETWTEAQIVQFVTNAVNLTKAYTGPLTVDQQQKFTFNIETISPNIPLVKNFAQSVIDGVLKGSQETLTFNGGYATTSEGETIPILLPKRQAFVLPEAGVAIEVVGFEHDMAKRYAEADACVSRAGASSCFELALAGLPAILVPLPGLARDHQTRNADMMVLRGAAVDFKQQDLLEGEKWKPLQRGINYLYIG